MADTDGIITPDGNQAVSGVLAQLITMAESIDARLDALARRENVRVTQGTAQAVPAGTLSAAANWANPGGVADPWGFFSTVNNFEPVVIPPGLGGLYLVQLSYGQTEQATTRGFLQLAVNGSTSDGRRTVFTGDDRMTTTYVRSLSAGDRLKLEFYSSNAAATHPGLVAMQVIRLGAL